MQVDRNAIWTESQNEETSRSVRPTASYHRSEKPSGGKAKIADGEKETAITIRIGARRKTSTSTSAVQHRAEPKRAISAPREAMPAGEPGRREHDHYRDHQHNHRHARPELEVADVEVCLRHHLRHRHETVADEEARRDIGGDPDREHE